MDTQTLILLSVGLITLATMVYCIMRTEDEPAQNNNTQTRYKDEPEEVFYDDDDGTSIYTVDDGAEESIFDSE